LPRHPPTAEQAVRLFVDHGRQIDLLVADVALPRRSGIYVALLLRAEIPQVELTGAAFEFASAADRTALERDRLQGFTGCRPVLNATYPRFVRTYTKRNGDDQKSRPGDRKLCPTATSNREPAILRARAEMSPPRGRLDKNMSAEVYRYWLDIASEEARVLCLPIRVVPRGLAASGSSGLHQGWSAS
jgi:hypothetical protein